jgi:hypothetical protein
MICSNSANGLLLNVKLQCLKQKFLQFFPEHAKNVKYSDMNRPVYEEDIIKAIKFKLNNKEQAWKKQCNELNKKDN